MPDIGWTHAIVTGDIDSVYETILQYLRNGNRSYIYVRDTDDRTPHFHIVFFNRSNSSGLRQILARFPNVFYKKRRLTCYTHTGEYLRSRRHHVEEVFVGEDTPPRCPRCRDENNGSDYPTDNFAHETFGEQVGLSCEFSETEDDNVDGGGESESGIGSERSFFRQNTKRSEQFRTIQKICKTELPRTTIELSKILENRGMVDIFLSKNFDAMVKTAITFVSDEIKTLSWEQLLQQYDESHYPQFDFCSRREGYEIIQDICRFNYIDPKELYTTVKNVLNRNTKKRNSIFFYGPKNSGKTLLANSIIRGTFLYSTLQNVQGRNSFEFSELCSCRAVLMNEPMITDATVEIFKNLLEGQEVSVPVKYKENQIISRVPIIITSNFDIAIYTSRRSEQEETINARCFRYTFRTCDNLINFEKDINPWSWLYFE